jgi:microcystin-dependent protein
MEGYLGEIRMFGGNWAPRGWAFCDGRLLAYDLYDGLFSILGTTYGGDGETTFALPDLRGRAAVGPGQGPGLPSVSLGEVAGSPEAILLSNNLPAHSHPMTVNDDTTGMASAGSGNYLNSKTESEEPVVASGPSSPALLNPGTVSAAGGSQPFSKMQPYLGLRYIICIEGIYPTRN